MRWGLSNRCDPVARDLADRHYNRQSPGAPGFVPPGRCLVLVIEATADHGGAFWVSHAPYPRFVKHRWPGLWVCTAFRNEGAGLSSELIREALAATVDAWGDPPGMLTFVDRDKTRPKRDPGRCYRRAGFAPAGESEGGLVALVCPPSAFPPPEPPRWRGVDARWDTRQQAMFR